MAYTITDIYTKYNILPTLALHQLRVAAVAKVVLEAIGLQDNDIISACLLHDMGNLIKFRLTDFPEFLEPEGAVYWEHKKAEMIEKYGTNEHKATVAIAKEIGVSQHCLECVDAVGFSQVIDIQQAPLSHKICNYADMRVGPYGVVTLQERFEDGRKRYASRTDRNLIKEERLQLLYEAAFQIERDIFSRSPLGHIEIHDIAIQDILENLRGWIIK